MRSGAQMLWETMMVSARHAADDGLLPPLTPTEAMRFEMVRVSLAISDAFSPAMREMGRQFGEVARQLERMRAGERRAAAALYPPSRNVEAAPRRAPRGAQPPRP